MLKTNTRSQDLNMIESLICVLLIDGNGYNRLSRKYGTNNFQMKDEKDRYIAESKAYFYNTQLSAIIAL